MKVSELFYSVQGEGKLVGVPSVFVRASGCNLRCGWCFAPDTPILRPDWSWTPIGDLRVGDHIMGRTLPDEGRHGALTVTQVLDVARRNAPLVRVNGEVTCTPDHPFWLAGQRGARSGWRAVSRCKGLKVAFLAGPPPRDQVAYELGYLAGMSDGDGTFWTLRFRRGYRRFRLACMNVSLLDRFSTYAGSAGYGLRRGAHVHNGFTGPGMMSALYLTKDQLAREFEADSATEREGESWAWGYVSGMIDAEGSMSPRVLRISQSPNANARTYERLCGTLGRLGIRFTREQKGIYLHASSGQLWKVLSSASPAKSSVQEGVFRRAPHTCRVIDDVKPLGTTGEVRTLTTECGSYVAGGYIVKNCDTPYASWNPEGEELSADEIVPRVDAFRAGHAFNHVVLTGGEPMIMPDVVAVCEAIKARGYHLTIETAATVYAPVTPDLASLSPKLSNSTPHLRAGGRFAAAHERQRINVPVVQKFIDSAPDFQLKFVVSGEGDLTEIRALLHDLRGWSPADVLLMPEGTDASTLDARAGWIAEACKRTGFRFCPRLHVLLYGNRRGT